MSEENYLGEAVALIDRQIASALCNTRKFRDLWGNGKLAYRKSLGGFATLVQPSQEEIEYEFFKSSLEFSIRNNIVNPLFDSLFELYGVDASWPEGSIIAWSGNVAHERINPIEFTIASNDETLGYRYTTPNMLTTDDIDDILEIWGIDRLVVIDWSGDETESLHKDDSELCIGGSDNITRVSLAEFFKRFFPAALYGEFVNRIRAAVDKAEDIIGFQAISRLSMPRLSSFRKEIVEDVRQVIECLPADLSIKGSDHTEYRLSDRDREALDKAFFTDGLGRSLGGTSGFARCFATSEYLQRAFRQGGEFDHTAVVCGYLKAVEQLAYDLMLATLETAGSDSLFIATHKRGRKYPLHRPFDWEQRTPHVQFTPQNIKMFSKTLPPLANLLHDNERAWRISDEGRHFVLLKLRAFAAKDRNGYFHKDNFTNPDEVKKIRKDAISLLYFLVGGYVIPGSQERQREILGMKYVPYNDMYMNLFSIPIHDFVVDFDGEEAIKAIRLYEQPAVEYDEYGLVSSKVLFVKVDDHRGHHDWGSIETFDKADVFEVSRENMPMKMSYVKRDGTQVQFWQKD